ncbi:hypothetical protein COM24_12580 [Bacillus toyonensis]|uniref:Group-specific protein n=2 Tax=Bacillus toyonensis TaxID=155322 RepID=A0A2B6NYR4_9BACI|nr:hypothetical protein Btoyo_1462 [Bacillus toyonensis BCT-7112]ARC31578.1 hypothetical protein A6J74_23445 [Bacillus sp. FDAARGOS_235]KAB0446486.1 hypothetical protein CH334_20195 [Lysinibacillus sp. VIA-II-2016]MBH0362182.1 hypothetical protein [Bacillus toyonensis biovar Thuringiensis]OTX37373.1 hypothetical protein BK717_10360 [Bacillus thuringiensis serovar malayensis]PDY52126.1 hypothetical protein CON61_16480 [Bacillus toyonensis]
MMNKRKWLYRIGILLVSIGCILANFYSDIPMLFPSLHKGIGMSVVVVGLLCLITSNFYRKSESI